MLDLHIWGPAFGLPSIDPECLAAIAYLRCIPQLNQSNGPRLWRIVPSSNPLLSPTKALPALCDGHTWTGGFTAITAYLRSVSRGEWDLDADLLSTDEYDHNDTQNHHHAKPKTSYTWAESIAYTSLIRAKLGPLVDISLYVSHENYENAVRPEYSNSGMLPWPVQYYVPGEKRSQVWGQCEALLRRYGLSTKDIDLSVPLDGSSGGRGLEAGVAAGGLGSGVAANMPATVGGIAGLARPPTASTAGVVFKLQTLISKVLTPVAARLVSDDGEDGDGVYFFKQATPTGIDCLILGYLCLAIYPALPNPYLVEGIRELDGGRGGKRVCAWVEKFRTKVFGQEMINAAAILRGEKTHSILPWGPVERTDLPWLTGYMASAAGAYAKELIPSWLTAERKNLHANETPEQKEHREKLEKAMRWEKVERAVTIIGGLGAFAAFLLGTGIIRFVPEEEDEDDGFEDINYSRQEDEHTEKEVQDDERPEEEEQEEEVFIPDSLRAEDFMGFFGTPATNQQDTQEENDTDAQASEQGNSAGSSAPRQESNSEEDSGSHPSAEN